MPLDLFRDNTPVHEDGYAEDQDQDGRLTGCGYYINNRREGFWRHFNHKGIEVANGFYKAGKRHDHWRIMKPRPRGRAEMWTGCYRDDKQVGSWSVKFGLLKQVPSTSAPSGFEYELDAFPEWSAADTKALDDHYDATGFFDELEAVIPHGPPKTVH